MDPAALRAAFPVLGRSAYLNAGTCGPLSAAPVQAATGVLEQAAAEGRAGAYFDATLELRARLRAAYAALLGAEPDDVALTTCTSEGIVRVLAGLELAPGDEVLTSTDEHPGLFGPLAAARAQRGLEIRVVPFEQLADAVSPATRLVACSHVSWIDGRRAPDLAGVDVPVLLDGAQGVGAVPVDVGALGCAFYAGSGQKWLCGPVGSGMLWVSPAWSERLRATGPTYVNLAVPQRPRWRSSPPPAGTRSTNAPPRSRRRSPTRWRSAGCRSRRATARRSSPGTTPTPSRRAGACWTPASSSATCQGGTCCGLRSAPGTTGPT
jgi:L-cysteine/cystine lyase